MDCRTFHRNLEDYLVGGLDFSGRFGMERHAQQCIGCGKTLTGAQRLHRMASELKRVKAPPNFESSVLNKIAIQKSHSLFSGIRSLWIYGIEWPSWRKLSLASSSLIVLGLILFYAFHRPVPNHESTVPTAAVESAKAPAKSKEDPAKMMNTNAENKPAAKSDQPHSKKPVVESTKVAGTTKPPLPYEEVDLQDQEIEEMQFVEYEVMGPDNRPVLIRLPMPKTIRMQYGQTSEESFLRNVSH